MSNHLLTATLASLLGLSPLATGDARFVAFETSGALSGVLVLDGEVWEIEAPVLSDFIAEEALALTFGFQIVNDVEIAAESSFSAVITTNEFGIQQVEIEVTGEALVDAGPDPPPGDRAEIEVDMGLEGLGLFVDGATPFSFRIISYDGGHTPDDRLDFDGGVTGVLPAGSTTDIAGVVGVAADLDERSDTLTLIALLTLTTPADITLDGVVDLADLIALLAAWGSGGGSADVNVDGVVDIADLIAVLAAWS